MGALSDALDMERGEGGMEERSSRKVWSKKERRGKGGGLAALDILCLLGDHSVSPS